MAISRVATWKDAKQGMAVLLKIDEKIIEIEHDDLSTLDTAAKVKSELDRQAGKVLDNVYIHINRDGSLAVATGNEPNLWPEDDPEAQWLKYLT